MIFIFQFLFFIFILFLIVGLVTAIRIYMKIRHAAGKFRDFAGGGFKSQNTASQNNNNGRTTFGKKKNYIIIDTRDEEVRNRKIFSDDVGEFVKYKEVK